MNEEKINFDDKKEILANRKKIILWLLFVTLAVFLGNLLYSAVYDAYHSNFSKSGNDYYAQPSGDGSSTGSSTYYDPSCNIGIIPIKGEVVPYPEYTSNNADVTADPDTVAEIIHTFSKNENIKGYMTVIDSYGGDSSSGDTIMNEIKRIDLPTVSLIRSAGDSAAYLIATAGDTIIASPWSDVGSIGVTMSYLDNTAQNKKEGLNFVQLSVGKYKDYMNPDKPLTDEERALIERDLNIIHKQFIKEVAENRNLSIDTVTKLADGSAMPGELALQNKLIDQLGDEATARAWFAKKLNIPADEVIFCK